MHDILFEAGQVIFLNMSSSRRLTLTINILPTLLLYRLIRLNQTTEQHIQTDTIGKTKDVHTNCQL